MYIYTVIVHILTSSADNDFLYPNEPKKKKKIFF